MVAGRFPPRMTPPPNAPMVVPTITTAHTGWAEPDPTQIQVTTERLIVSLRSEAIKRGQDQRGYWLCVQAADELLRLAARVRELEARDG